MKVKQLFLAAMVLPIFMTSCVKEAEISSGTGLTAYANIAQLDDATKSHGAYSYSIVWDEEDQIAVLGNGNKDTFTLVSGAGTTKGTFSQDTPACDLGSDLTAFVPTSVVDDNNSYVWPSVQPDIKSVALAPMVATSHSVSGNDVKFDFKHLGSVLQLVLTAKNGDIPVQRIDIFADQNLSGPFTVADDAAVMPEVEPGGETTGITTGDISSKNIVIGAGACYLNFAVPSGSYTNFTIVITGEEGKRYTLRAANFSLTRATVSKITYAVNRNEFNNFEAKVNGHKVTINEATELSDFEVLSKIYTLGDKLYINATSVLGRGLTCTIEGDAKVSKVLYDGYYYTFTISDVNTDVTATLRYQHATGVKLDRSFVGVEFGKNRTLVPTIEPFDAYLKDVIWRSSNPEIATVDQSGLVHGIINGQTTISVTTVDGDFVAECVVEVMDKIAENMILDRMEIQPALGWVVSIRPIFFPANSSCQRLSWKIEDPSVASVDEYGNVHTLSPGKTAIWARTIDGSDIERTCTITVGDALPYSLPYEFSVSETKKVHFSRGNLWYGPKDGQDAAFHFEDEQNLGGLNNTSEHRCYFYGGSSVESAFSEYQPFGAPLFTNQPEFTVENISNGAYFTLSCDEWKYLLTKRPDRGEHRFVKGRIKGMRGLILLPDTYTGIISETGVTFYAPRDNEEIWDSLDASYWRYPTEDIPEDIWAQMESSGCVFLPAAGSSRVVVNRTGLYWSSTLTSNVYDFGGHKISFNEEMYNINENSAGDASIRLVTETPSEYNNAESGK